jgi:UDP-N-acetylglucosamine:LPS N-acetylglucosamine transferase
LEHARGRGVLVTPRADLVVSAGYRTRAGGEVRGEVRDEDRRDDGRFDEVLSGAQSDCDGLPHPIGFAGPTAAAVLKFALVEDRKTVLVFGGSKGARSINRAIEAVIEQLLAKYQVIHISGSADAVEVQAKRNSLSEELKRQYHVFEYVHEMGLAFAAADLVVSRAGASILGEYPLFGLPSILIPYPHAWRYQKVNADYLWRTARRFAWTMRP